MATRKAIHDRSTPPPHGPGTDGPVWCDRGNRGSGWVFPLNDHGRKVVEGFMRKYHDWPSGSITGFDGGRFKVTGKTVYISARSLLGDEESHSVACDAVVRAAANYKPQDHGCRDEAYSYIVYGIYFALKRAVDAAILRRSRLREVQAVELKAGEGVDSLDVAEGHEPDPAAVSEMKLWREGLDEVAKCLPARERQVICCRFKYEWSLSEIARRMGVSAERVRGLEKNALAKLRRAFERKGFTPDTPGDGMYPPPPRSPRCPRRNQTAAR